jgi:hypothetical protein
VAVIANGAWRGDFAGLCLRVLAFLGLGPLNVLFDLPGVALRALRGRIGARAVIAWVLPLGLRAFFLALFVAANPVIEGWLSALDIATLLAALDVRRIAFWSLLVAVVWPFVLYRSLAQRRAGPRAPRRRDAGRHHWPAPLGDHHGRRDAALARSLQRDVRRADGARRRDFAGGTWLSGGGKLDGR